MRLYDGSRDTIARPTRHTVELVTAGVITNHVGADGLRHEILTLREQGRTDWSLYFVESGEIRFDDALLTAGEFWIYPPNVRHRYIIEKPNTVYHYIHFTGSCVEELLRELNYPLMQPFRPASLPESSVFERIEKLYRDGEAGIEIEWRLLRLLSLAEPSLHKKDERNLFSVLLEEMAQTYYIPYDAAYYAEKLDLSVSRFNHLFKKEVGDSPHHYYTGIRITNAAHLLKYTTLPIQKVASSVGYDDPLYFNRVFNKWIGCSPRDYRKEQAE